MALEAQTSFSIDDVAASMIVRSDPAPVQEVDEIEEEDDQAIVEDDSEEEEVDASSDEDTTATDDEEADEDDESYETFQLTDDTLVSVTVDGEVKEATLADLKRAYSGEGAIEKRLQLATETRKSAETFKVQAEQELNTGRQNLVKAFSAFENLLFQPQVEQPDAALQQSNPTQYLMQMEAWRQDQASLTTKRQKVQQALQMSQQSQQQQVEQLKQHNAQLLVEMLPDLRDPVKGKEVQSLILEGARAYGFSDAEIGEAYDARMFKMAADAASYQRMLKNGKVRPQSPSNTVRTMKPGSPQQLAKATTYAKRQTAALETARKTGRVEDIAATMLVRKPKR